jgi:hypothetical protein
MSEQQTKPKSFMEELDQWIDDEVFEKLYVIWGASQDGDMTATAESVKKAIKQKVLDSYHNGLRAAQRPAARTEVPKRASGWKH